MNTTQTLFTLSDVKSTLQALRFSNPLPQTLLHDYLIEQDVISDNMIVQLRDYYIATWLYNMITLQYNNRRYYHNLTELHSEMPKSILLKHFREDYVQTDTDLESWSTMFLHHSGLLFNLSASEHESIAGLTKRTLNRRQKRGYELIYLQILLS